MSGYNGTNGWNGNTGPAITGGDASNPASTLGPKGGGANLAGAKGFQYGPSSDTTAATPQYGGYSGGANDAANMYGGLAAASRNTVTPTIGNQANTDQDRSQYNDAQAQQQQALGLLQNTANGGTTVADTQFQGNLGASIGAQHAAAAGARGGGPALAAAQRGYGMQSAMMNGAGQQQAQILHAQQQQAAQQQLMQGQLAVGGQQLGAQGQYYGQGLAAANLHQNQGALNDAGSLGAQGLAFGAQQGQLNADAGTYAANQKAAADQARRDQDANNAVLKGAAGVAGAVIGI